MRHPRGHPDSANHRYLTLVCDLTHATEGSDVLVGSKYVWSKIQTIKKMVYGFRTKGGILCAVAAMEMTMTMRCSLGAVAVVTVRVQIACRLADTTVRREAGVRELSAATGGGVR